MIKTINIWRKLHTTLQHNFRYFSDTCSTKIDYYTTSWHHLIAILRRLQVTLLCLLVRCSCVITLVSSSDVCTPRNSICWWEEEVHLLPFVLWTLRHCSGQPVHLASGGCRRLLSTNEIVSRLTPRWFCQLIN